MNIPYLLKVLDTNKLSELVANIDAPPLDINLAIWDAISAGEVEVDEEKDRITALIDAVPSSDPDIMNKILLVVRHYAKNKTNVTRGRLYGYAKDPVTRQGYLWHEYITAMQYLVDTGQVVEETISVPKAKKRPYHKFVFLGLPENPNDELNATTVNKWIDSFDKSKVK